MKCREGCDGTKSSAELVCMQCWRRLPSTLRVKVIYAASVAPMKQIEREIRDWLAADDKRRAE